jgi:hypothetical protein
MRHARHSLPPQYRLVLVVALVEDELIEMLAQVDVEVQKLLTLHSARHGCRCTAGST